MKALCPTIGLALFLIGSQPLAGQFISAPVWVSPKGGTGLTLAAEYGRGLNDESGENTSLVARATLGVSALSLGVGVGSINPRVDLDRSTEFQYAAFGAIRLIGGALLPGAVNVHAGVSVFNADLGTDTERRVINVPVGVGLSLNIPAVAFSLEPWFAPRVNYVRTSQGDDAGTQIGLGASAGINLGIANGLGLRAALDWSDLDSGDLFIPGDLPSIQPAVLGIGIEYALRLPGL